MTANTRKGAKISALGRLSCGYSISSPMAQQVSKPAKHHQTSATQGKNAPAAWGAADAKYALSKAGAMDSTHTRATPQKKNRNPFCSRPPSWAPRSASSKNSASARQAAR